MTNSITTITKLENVSLISTSLHPAKHHREIAMSFDPSRIKIKSQAIYRILVRILMTTLMEPSKLMEMRRINPRA